MKKTLLLCCVSFAATHLFSLGCFAQALSDIQKIQARGKLVISLCKQDYPPFFFHNSKGEIEGYDIEIAKEIAKEIGVKVEFQQTSPTFNDVAYEVAKENADLGISALSATTKRGIIVGLTQAYLKINKVLIVNRVLQLKLDSNEDYAKTHDIKFGVLKNSSYEALLKEKYYLISKFAMPNQVVLYNTSEDAMNDVMSGKIYALFTDEINANFLIKSAHSANIYSKKTLLKGQIDPIAVAVNLKNSTLLNWLNLLIENINYNGTQSLIATKYLKGYN